MFKSVFKTLERFVKGVKLLPKGCFTQRVFKKKFSTFVVLFHLKKKGRIIEFYPIYVRRQKGLSNNKVVTSLASCLRQKSVLSKREFLEAGIRASRNDFLIH